MAIRIEVVDRETEQAVKVFAPTHERRAEKIEDGVNINLNHERYYTRRVTVEDSPQ